MRIMGLRFTILYILRRLLSDFKWLIRGRLILQSSVLSIMQFYVSVDMYNFLFCTKFVE